MDKLVEFGYPVSKDYGKLWGLLGGDNNIVCFITYGGERIPCFYEDRDILNPIDKIEGQDDKYTFTNHCLGHNLTFIDPEPTDKCGEGGGMKNPTKETLWIRLIPLWVLLWTLAVIGGLAYLFNFIFGVNFFDIGLLL